MMSHKSPTASPSTHHRLGEHLLAAGLLTGAQLDEAIEYQCIYGGKLGTSLIELDLLTEDQLAHVLSRQLKLHYIKPELLMNVTDDVIALIPAKIALEQLIVPYRKDGKKLYVAMADPTNEKNVASLSARLNHIIVPLAIPEFRLMMALKQYYGKPLTPRVETLGVQLKYREMAAIKKIFQQQSANAAAANHQSQKIKEEDKQPRQFVERRSKPRNVSASTHILSEQNPAEANYEALLQRLAGARKRDDIATAIIDFLRNDFPDCALLMVRGGNATGWLASLHQPTLSFEHTIISLQKESVFHQVALRHEHFIGRVTDSTENRKILSYFDSEPPQEALVIPFKVKGKLVSLLYIQEPVKNLTPRVDELLHIAEKAEMSFKMLILRNKILYNLK